MTRTCWVFVLDVLFVGALRLACAVTLGELCVSGWKEQGPCIASSPWSAMPNIECVQTSNGNGLNLQCTCDPTCETPKTTPHMHMYTHTKNHLHLL